MKSQYKISYYLRIVLTIAAYIIFYYYIINSCIHAESKSQLYFNIIIGVIFGGFAILAEYLRMSYDAATKNLIIDGKPDKALEKIARVEKADIFKTYKTSCQMMRMLALVDLRRFPELLSYIDSIETKEYDVELIRRYTQMLAYGEQDQRGKSNEAFKKLVSVRDYRNDKGKRFKGAYFLNWEVVNGQHKNYEGDYDGAMRYLNDIDEKNMNLRELVQYLLAKLKAAKKLGNQEVYDNCKERLLKSTQNNQTMKDYIETL